MVPPMEAEEDEPLDLLLGSGDPQEEDDPMLLVPSGSPDSAPPAPHLLKGKQYAVETLPSFLEGVRAYISVSSSPSPYASVPATGTPPPHESLAHALKRYIIAYGGDVVDLGSVIEPVSSMDSGEGNGQVVTHIIAEEWGDELIASIGGEVVTPAWVWACVHAQRLLPTQNYLLSALPPFSKQIK
jgi:hypothetical protein